MSKYSFEGQCVHCNGYSSELNAANECRNCTGENADQPKDTPQWATETIWATLDEHRPLHLATRVLKRMKQLTTLELLLIGAATQGGHTRQCASAAARQVIDDL